MAEISSSTKPARKPNGQEAVVVAAVMAAGVAAAVIAEIAVAAAADVVEIVVTAVIAAIAGSFSLLLSFSCSVLRANRPCARSTRPAGRFLLC